MESYRRLFLLAVVFVLSFPSVESQVMAGFENFGLQPGEYLNDASPADGFRSGSIELPNYYDQEFNFWSGWAISADTNTTTPGFLNQYSCITGTGALKTPTYCIGYSYDPILIRLQPNAIGKPMIGMYVNNTTYTYLSMRDGDAFAKKFGGETGTDPDFLMLTIKKYSGGAIDDDSINVYLADYRFEQTQKDFILAEWTYVDLTVLGEVDSLLIRMTSSDVGVFGMNTPAYFCIDQVSTDNLLSASYFDHSIQRMTVSPNPASETLFLEAHAAGWYAITNLQGQIVWTSKLPPGHHQISVEGWTKGLYVLTFNGGAGTKVIID